MLKLHLILVSFYNTICELSKKSAMSYKNRMAMYRMLEKMTGEPATLQINEAIMELRNLHAKSDYKSCMWFVLDDVIEQMRSMGVDFAKALSKYVPQQDIMILSASEQDDITLGFATVIENNKKTSAMKKAFIQALSYPLLMLLVLLALLYYFSVEVIPAFTDHLPDGVVLSPSSIFLVYMADSFNWWFSILSLVTLISSCFIIWALPNLANYQRKYLENIPPFNMYRIMVGCGFLFALNSLGRAGFMQIDALEQMLQLAKPYLRHRVLVIMDLMADGMDLGQALIESKLDFPDRQMVRELAIQTKYSDDDSLEILSSTLAEDGLESIKRQANILKFIITCIVFSTIGFLYFGVYQFGMDLSNIKPD